jgi:hypothetical protein
VHEESNERELMKTESRRRQKWLQASLLGLLAASLPTHAFYSPTTGRWLSRDPIGEEGAVNLYGFVDNDPVSRIDAFGEKIIIVPFPIPIPIPVPPSEWELKHAGYLFWRTFKITSPHWREVMDDWFWEKLPSRTFTGLSDPRNKDIASNIGFLKLLRCVFAKKRGLSVPAGRWEVGYKGFQWQYTLTRAEAVGGEAAFTPATEFLGSYRAEVQDRGPVAAGQSTIHKVRIHVKNISDWYSATRIPGRFGGGSIWPSHPQHDIRYNPRQSIGGTFLNDYDFEVEEDVCNAKCELP